MRLRAVAVLVVAGMATLPGVASAAENGWELPAMSVPAAQAVSKGEGVTVAVIDTGVRTAHPVLGGRATEGPDFLESDDEGKPWYGVHGTSMASSVLDVAPAAKVLGLRAIRENEDPEFRTWADQLKNPKADPAASEAIQRAIRYAADNGARVISMSLGTDSPISAYDDDQAEAVQYALAKGAVVVASAGNEGDEDNPVGYPAAYPGVLTIAASTPSGARAEFSTVHSYVDVSAPGVAIDGADVTTTGRKQVQGTSSAAALTSGVAALIVAKYPKLAPRQIMQVLERTASTFSAGHNPLTGYGVINAEAALHEAATLTPESAILPVGGGGAGGHFGPGDDGTPRVTTVGIDSEYIVLGAAVGGFGAVAVLVGILLLRSSRRARGRPDPTR